MKEENAIFKIIRSPWVMITLPLLLGGMWLINNTWVITDNLDKPYMLLAGPATIITGLAAWATFAFFKAISSWYKSTWQEFATWKKKDGSSFWLVIYIFLTISVLESGTYFGYLLGANSFYGTLGYASAFAIDLVTVVCMRARLNAVRMRDQKGATIHLIGLTFCAAISTFANGFTALYHWQAPQHTAIPPLMIQTAPAVGVIFPLLIIFLSLAGDYTADQSSSKLNPEEYRMSEQKRIDLIAIQRDMMRSRLQIEQEIDQMTQRLRSGKSGRTFFLIAWLFPRDPLSMQAVAETVTEEVKKAYDAQFTQLSGQITNQIRQLGEQATQSTRQFQENIQSNLGASEAKLASSNEQIATLAKHFQSTEQIQTDIQAVLGTMQTNYEALIMQQSEASGQMTELKQYTERYQEQIHQQQTDINRQMVELRDNTERHQEHTLTTLTAKVSESIASELQSYIIPDETMITELIESAIRPYTECETDDVCTPIEGEKPLYRFYTPELKEVVARFPVIDSWIRAGRRTISLQDVVTVTNFTSQFVSRQANDGMFTKTQTKNIYTTKSVVNWLKTNPSPKRKSTKEQEQITEEMERIPQQDFRETEKISAITEKQNGHNHSDKTTVNLDEYAELTAV